MTGPFDLPTLETFIRRAEEDPTYASRGQLDRWRAERRQLLSGSNQSEYAEMPTLAQEHQDMLKGSAISSTVIQARGYRTVVYESELEALGFAAEQCRVPGLLLPLWTTDGQNSVYVYRPDTPRTFEDKTKGKNSDGTYPQKILKYEYPKGREMRLDCPPPCQPRLGDPSVPLWITEGQKKADALASVEQCAIALLGVWNWRGKNVLGGATVLADWEHVALKDRDVRIIFDSDLKKNKHVQAALSRLADWLKSKGARVRTALLPEIDGHKAGIDDWLAASHRLEELEGLLQEPVHVAGRSERILSEEYIQALDQLGYRFKMLELDYTVEVNGEPLNDAMEAKIRTQLRDAGYEHVNIARDAYIAHAYDHRYHPIKDYLAAHTWDGQDHIAALAGYFTDEDGVFEMWLRKWLIGAVARVYKNGTQNRALVLDGPQDIGKSYFVRWLASGLMGKYYMDSAVDPDNKDDHIRLMNVWIWEIGELHATTGRVDRNALKQFLSREQVRVRVPYGRNDIVRPALTSFIATANNDGGFFNDPTGNRRFAACTLKAINWAYAAEINVDQVWAQAKHLFDIGEPWRFTGEERERVNEINSRYEVENPVFTWLDGIVEADSNRNTTTIEILETLRSLDARGSDSGLSRDIASYMKAHGIKSGKFYVPKNGKRVQLRGWLGVSLRRNGPAQRLEAELPEPEWEQH